MLPAKKPIYQIYAKQQGSKRCYCSLINCESFCIQKQSFSRLQKKEKKISEPSGLSLVTSPRHLSWKSHIQKTRRPKKLFSIHPRFWDCFYKSLHQTCSTTVTFIRHCTVYTHYTVHRLLSRTTYSPCRLWRLQEKDWVSKNSFRPLEPLFQCSIFPERPKNLLPLLKSWQKNGRKKG